MNKTLIILTSGRTGSSSFVKLMEIFNFYTINPLKINFFIEQIKKSNLKGHYEEVEVITFNEKILHQNNLAWFSIKKVIKQIPKDIKNDISNYLLNLCSTNNKIILKDPRFSSTIKVWEKIFQKNNMNVEYIFLYRDPGEYIESIKRRDRFSNQTAAGNWISDNYEILKFLKNKKFFCFNFNEIFNEPEIIAKSVKKNLNIKYNKKELHKFKNNFVNLNLIRASRELKNNCEICNELLLQIKKLNHFQEGHNLKLKKNIPIKIDEMHNKQSKNILFRILKIIDQLKFKIRFIYTNHKH